MSKKTLRKKILHCLKKYTETRNNDTTLTIKVWKEFNPEHFGRDGESMKVTALHELPKMATISRCRRKIQNEEHKYLPTKKEVAMRRGIQQTMWERWAATS